MMSIDAIKQVAQAEQETQARKVQAQGEAKRLVAEAERAGQARVAARRSEAEAQVGEMMKQAEERAAQRTQTVMQETAGECDALRETAKGRMAKAAGLIVERVVNS